MGFFDALFIYFVLCDCETEYIVSVFDKIYTFFQIPNYYVKCNARESLNGCFFRDSSKSGVHRKKPHKFVFLAYFSYY